ncbi:unnamed protein product [Chironomus riparius]|uniref:UDP-glucuronosyltransferase n=1 Tax=Chironomus riparius TaxID=315576 RepID=A0A9N9WN54_9DIPT|nr:unnamed protein product [Chironomus riparius]
MKFFIFLIVLQASKASKILGIFPTPSISHQIGFHVLMKDLAARGHELTILTTDAIKIENPNVTQIDLHSAYEVFKREFNFVKISKSDMDEADHIEYFSWITEIFLDEELSHAEVQKLIVDKNKYEFDVMIIEHIYYTPMLAFAELYDIPVIGISTTDMFNENHEMIGNSANIVLHPEIMFPFVQGRLNFQERLKCLKYLLKYKFRIQPSHNIKMKRIVEKHFPTVNPDLEKLNNRIEFLIVNAHPVMGYIRPILPNTVQIGFMHIEAPKPLKDGPLKHFLDNSEHGVIYMSFGSNVQSTDLSSEIKGMFLNTFKRLKYDFIWKFENDDLPEKPENVMIQKWLPQADLLAHPNIKLFITHGGQQSMEETIDRAVPTIVIPFIGDQPANAKRMEQKEIGKHLELKSLTSEKLKSTILEMLKPKYKEKIQKLRELVYDQPMAPRDKAIWCIEYVIRYKGAKHFHYIGKDVPFYEKYFLDFAAIGISTVCVLMLAGYYAVKKLFFAKTVKNKRNKLE